LDNVSRLKDYQCYFMTLILTKCSKYLLTKSKYVHYGGGEREWQFVMSVERLQSLQMVYVKSARKKWLIKVSFFI